VQGFASRRESLPSCQLLAVVDDLTDQCAADSLAAGGRNQSDIDDTDFAGPTGEAQPANGLVSEFANRKLRAG
jgi:hypothetical protein